MARGWESKSVEAQQAEASSESQPSRPRLTSEQIQQLRKLEGLNLSRRHVEQQLAAAREPRRQQMLRRALADLEVQIRELTRPA